jgi:hypothetical protein
MKKLAAAFAVVFFAVSALGCYLSVQLDTPTGATIVVTFGGILVLMFLMHLIVHHRRSSALAAARSAQHELSREGITDPHC